MSEFNLKGFREEFLQSDGWKVSDCYKPHDDKFLRRDAQDAYEGAKWAWQSQQAKIDELQRKIAFQEKAIKNIKLQFENKQIDCDRSDRKIEELQARIDEASQMLEYNEYTDSALQAIDILKGK